MATLTVEITDAAWRFIDDQVASGRFQNASALVETLLSQANWLVHSPSRFTEQEKNQIDAMLLEAVESDKRGESVVHQPGDLRRIWEEMKRKHREPTTP